MPINKYIKMIMLNVLGRWFWLMALPIATCIILAIFVSYKFVLVALMILFLILPFVLMMVYFYYSSTQEAQISILKKRMEITHEGIRVYFSPILRHKYDTDEEDEYFDFDDDDDDYDYESDSARHISDFAMLGMDEDFEEEGFDFGDEETTIYEVKCACGNVIDFDEKTLISGSIRCEKCGELLEFSLDEEEDDADDNDEDAE